MVTYGLQDAVTNRPALDNRMDLNTAATHLFFDSFYLVSSGAICREGSRRSLRKGIAHGIDYVDDYQGRTVLMCNLLGTPERI
jgi:hypothetical protein